MPLFGEDTREALAEKDGVFGYDDAHLQITAVIVVPSPGALTMPRVPPTERTRSRSAGSGASHGTPPIPSSVTTTASRSPLLATVTPMREAPACLSALATASETTR